MLRILFSQRITRSSVARSTRSRRHRFLRILSRCDSRQEKEYQVLCIIYREERLSKPIISEVHRHSRSIGDSSDIEVSEDVADVRAGAGLRNQVRVEGVRVRETFVTDMILVGNWEVFLVDLGPMLFHVVLAHLSLCGVPLATTGVAADWLSVLIWIWRGCSRM